MNTASMAVVKFSVEVIMLPVSDVERALRFYVDQVGFTLDVDYSPNGAFRVVQLTPPGSNCSIQIGCGLTDAPVGSLRNVYLVVTDLEAVRSRLLERGVEVSAIRHKVPIDAWDGGFAAGLDPAHIFVKDPRGPAASGPSLTRWRTPRCPVVAPLPTKSSARGMRDIENILPVSDRCPTGSSSGQSRRPTTTSLERVMRYLCLVYGTEDSLPVMQNPNPISIAEVDALTQDSLAYNDMLRASGHFIVAHALRSVRTATTVRGRGGKVLVTDGPFAETKEQLLGFVLIEAKDHHEAVEVASRIPLARLGSIEVRSIVDLAR